MVLVVVFFVCAAGATRSYYSVVDFDGISAEPAVRRARQLRSRCSPTPRSGTRSATTLIWIVVGTAAPLILGLLLSRCCSGPSGVAAGSTGWRFFLPYVLPGVAIGIVWGWIYDPVRAG